MKAPPFLKACPDYGDCFQGPLFQHDRAGDVLKRKLFKNTTTLPSPNEAPVNGTTGKSSLLPICSADGLFNPDTMSSCGCVSTLISCCPGGQYNGYNYGVAGNVAGPWYALNAPSNSSDGNPLKVLNTFAALDALLGVTIITPGTGFTDGAVLTVSGGTPDRAAKFRIRAAGGVITGIIFDPAKRILDEDEVTILNDPGVYPTNLTALTTATGGGGTGAVFAFTRQDAVQDFGTCAMVGWAAVVSVRNWQGMFPFTSDGCPDTIKLCTYSQAVKDGLLCDPGSQISQGDFCDWTPTYIPRYSWQLYESYRAAAQPLKYLKMVATAESKRESPCIAEFDYTKERVVQFDPNSGEMSSSGSDPAGELTALDALLAKVLAGCASISGFILDSSFYEQSNLYTVTATDNGASIFRISDSRTIFSWGITFSGGDVSCFFDTGGFPANSCDFTGIPSWSDSMIHEELQITENTFHYKKVTQSQSGIDVQFTDTQEVTATISNDNTSASVLADAEANMVQWNMLDRVLMPLVTNNWSGVIPKVTRNETGPRGFDLTRPLTLDDYRHPTAGSGTMMDPYTAWEQMDWIDMTCYTFVFPAGTNQGTSAATSLDRIVDGSVLGLPLPITDMGGEGVPQDYYDSHFLNRVKCDDPAGYYVKNYGGWRSKADAELEGAATVTLPPRATQWTNPYEAAGLGIGRMRRYGMRTNPDDVNPTNQLWVTKWCESVIRFPGYDHARPYGADRDLKNLDLTPTPKPVICDEDSETVICNPAYTGPGGAGDCRRFPFCPPFGGRLAISSITRESGDGGTNWYYTITHDAMPVLNNVSPSGVVGGDFGWYYLDICHHDMERIGSNKPPLAGSTTTTTIIAEPRTPANTDPADDEFLQAKYICLTGARPGALDTIFIPDKNGVPFGGAGYIDTLMPHWYWADPAGRGNFIKFEWDKDFRTDAERTRLTGIHIINTVASGEFYDDGTTPLGSTICTTASGTNPSMPTANYGYHVDTTTIEDKCKGFVTCAPWLIVLSPNASDTPSPGTGVRYDFEGVTALDETYGSRQYLDVAQAMSDPLWQVPLRCNITDTGLETDAPYCIPWREARAVLPYATAQTTQPDNGAGAGQNESPPAPPVDYTLLNAGTNPSGTKEPGPTDQPVHIYAPTGIFAGC